jgi:arginine exporter protein ArgO
MWAWHPSVLTAAVWPLTLTALIVSWYRLPIGEWPRAILLGLALYLLLGVAIRLMQRHGFGFQVAAYTDSVIWIALMGFWAYAAWRRDRPSEARPLDLAVADA